MNRKTPAPSLVLTGQYCRPRYEVQVHGESVWLPPSEFAAMLALVRPKPPAARPLACLR